MKCLFDSLWSTSKGLASATWIYSFVLGICITWSSLRLKNKRKPTLQWLKQRCYCLIIQEAGSLRSKCPQGGCTRVLSLLLADDLPPAATSNGCLSEHVDLSCLCVHISSFYKGASQTDWIRAHLYGLILTSSSLERSYLNM